MQALNLDILYLITQGKESYPIKKNPKVVDLHQFLMLMHEKTAIDYPFQCTTKRIAL
jgi:hypothetical protein